MSFQDKSLQCSDCGATFTFSTRDQEFFQTKGFTNEPKRCPTCRSARKQSTGGFGNGGYSSGGSNYRSPRQMFPTTCSQCGKNTEVPFEPREGRPVYCSDCYSSIKPSR